MYSIGTSMKILDKRYFKSRALNFSLSIGQSQNEKETQLIPKNVGKAGTN